jgi:hypothetical protein
VSQKVSIAPARGHGAALIRRITRALTHPAAAPAQPPCPTCGGRRGPRPNRLCKSCRAYCTPLGIANRNRRPFCDVVERYTVEHCGCLTHWRACSCVTAGRGTAAPVVSLSARRPAVAR